MYPRLYRLALLTLGVFDRCCVYIVRCELFSDFCFYLKKYTKISFLDWSITKSYCVILMMLEHWLFIIHKSHHHNYLVLDFIIWLHTQNSVRHSISILTTINIRSVATSYFVYRRVQWKMIVIWLILSIENIFFILKSLSS